MKYLVAYREDYSFNHEAQEYEYSGLWARVLKDTDSIRDWIKVQGAKIIAEGLSEEGAEKVADNFNNIR